MSDYSNTRLRLRINALSPAFEGTPQEFIAELVRLSSIVSPTDFLYVVVGGSAPTTNEGIWLKDGTKPYVWDTGTSQYIPAVLTDSLTSIIDAIAQLQDYIGDGRVIFSATEPTAEHRSNSIWVQTSSSRPVALRWWTGTVWAYLPDRFPAVTTTGTANAHVATFGLTGVALADLNNKILFLRPGTTNTGAVTLAVDGTAATAVRIGTTALAAGQFEAGKEYLVCYDGTFYQLLNPSLPDVITAQTATNVQSLTVNAKGQVTAVASVGSGSALVRSAVTFDGSLPFLTKTVTDVSTADNTLTITGHGWSTGQLCWFETSADATGTTLGEETPYYVEVVDANKIRLYSTKLGATSADVSKLVDVTGNGTGLSASLTYWDGNPMLGTPIGVDGVIAVTLGSGRSYGIDFTTDLADAHYVISALPKTGSGPSAAFQPYATEPPDQDPSAGLAWVAALDEDNGYFSPTRFRVAIIA